ncbi:MAG: OsmC family protein [Ferruginibacter sp.]
MKKVHHYAVQTSWTGNTGTGTATYSSYDRSHIVRGSEGKEIFLSSDPSFRGDPSKFNPEELLLASLSSCHMLWYLHLCADSGIVVTHYTDSASAEMLEENGKGRFTKVILRPAVVVEKPEHIQKALSIHVDAHANCYIANSCNFPVLHEPRVSGI